MQKYLVALVVMLVSKLSLADLVPIAETTVIPNKTQAPQLKTYKLNNSGSKKIFEQKRTIDFPTHFVDMEVDLSTYNIGCDEAYTALYNTFLIKLDHEHMSYAGGIGCSGYQDQAEKMVINLNFDPIQDDGIEYAKQFMAEYDGMDFFGVPFKIREVKGIVTLLHFDVGTKNNEQYGSMFTFNNAIYFNSIYDYNSTLIEDVANKMQTNDSVLVADFMKQWSGVEGSSYILDILAQSNYWTLTPEVIYLVDSNEKVHKQPYSIFYHNDCSRYPSKMCLG